MKLCITTAFDEKYAPLGELCVRSLRKYASVFGHDVHAEHVNEADLGGFDPVWAKFPTALKLFGRGYDFVVWTDCDTLFVCTDRDYQLRFLAFDSPSLAVRSSLEVQLNGVPIPLMSELTDGVTSCAGILPRAAIDRRAAPARLSFHVMHTLCPFELNLDHLDKRQLGVALGGVEIAPADSLDAASAAEDR